MKTKQQSILELSSHEIYQKKFNELKSCVEKVALLLSKHEHLRNCDRCLIKNYHYYIDGYRHQTDRNTIHGLTPEGSILRARRKIQNYFGMWLPTNKRVIEMRKVCSIAVRDWSMMERNLNLFVDGVE